MPLVRATREMLPVSGSMTVRLSASLWSKRTKHLIALRGRQTLIAWGKATAVVAVAEQDLAAAADLFGAV